MIYELLNPSDQVTFEASDKRVAVSVCVLLGAGRFGLDAETDVALDSFWYCDMAERKAIVAAIGTDPTARVRYNEAKRSSVNNIGAAAVQWSKRLRERVGSKNETAEAP